MILLKKIFAIIIVVIAIIGIGIFMEKYIVLNDDYYKESSLFLKQIEFDAIYLENDHVIQVSFNDKSNNTKSAILEILGMDVTYHQEYIFTNNSDFVEKMYIEEVPKYGWKTTPVTLEINHSEFGNIGLKTEIYEPEQSKPKIIVEQK
jgi:hypothetical protein